MKVIFFDSHCHIDDFIFNNDFKMIMDKFRANNISCINIVGVDELTSFRAELLSKKYNGVYSSIGFHPHNSYKCDSNALINLEKLSKSSKVIAWGEIGLDFNRMYSDSNKQEVVLTRQIEIAARLNLPIIFHERDTNGRLLDIINMYSEECKKSVIHCFSGDYKDLKKYLNFGFFIGITGIVSMLKRGLNLRKILKYVPSDRILVETDSPYLSSVPYKIKTRRNEPSFLFYIILKIAEVKQKNINKLAKQFWKNTCNFFKINPNYKLY